MYCNLSQHNNCCIYPIFVVSSNSLQKYFKFVSDLMRFYLSHDIQLMSSVPNLPVHSKLTPRMLVFRKKTGTKFVISKRKATTGPSLHLKNHECLNHKHSQENYSEFDNLFQTYTMLACFQHKLATKERIISRKKSTTVRQFI